LTVESSVQDGVGLVFFANPPVNALSARARVPQDLLAACTALDRDASARAIVVAARGRHFSGGADIAEFSDNPAADVGDLRAAIEGLDALAKPLVMALHGVVFGGGLELAMIGRARIAAPGASLALPEVTLGLVPGAGGTQRLPRLVGVKEALAMAATGRPIDARKALAIGLIDRLAEGDLVEAALAFAQELAQAGAPERARLRPVPAFGADDFREAQAATIRAAGRNPAVAGVIACIETATRLPFAEGLAYEAAAFDELVLSRPSKGLRHAFLSERAAAKVPGLATAGASPRAVESVAIVGAGTMGTGIAIAVLNGGFRVTLIDSSPESLARALATIEATFADNVTRGRMSEAEAKRRRERLASSGDIASIASADLIIEAVFEDMNVKREVFRKIDGLAKPDAILCSNTSTLDIDAIAAATRRPQSVLGLHFFSPANIMKLVEVVRGARTSPDMLVAAMKFVQTLRKVAVLSGNCDGFIGNRIMEEYLRQAYLLLEEGALPAQVDAALQGFGMAMGPLRMMDLVGQDIGWAIRRRRAVEQPERPYSKIPDLLCEKGRFGQKTGAGYYLYPQGSRTAVVDPEITALIEAHSRAIGRARRTISDAEIVDRCILAMVNEGAKIVAEGVAARPLDIDVVYVNGYGFPADRGGPMFHADTLGLSDVLARIESFADGPDGWAFAPAPLLVELVKTGRKFADLDKASA
jgi:3-hydroxyacyl-CoA dehydrogenase